MGVADNPAHTEYIYKDSKFSQANFESFLCNTYNPPMLLSIVYSPVLLFGKT